MGCFIYLASGNQKNRPFGYIIDIIAVKVGTADEAFQVKIVLSLRHNTFCFATKLPLYKAARKDTIFRKIIVTLQYGNQEGTKNIGIFGRL